MLRHLALLTAAVGGCLASDGAVSCKEQEHESCAQKGPDTMLLQTHLGLSQEGSMTNHASGLDMANQLGEKVIYTNVSELPSSAVIIPAKSTGFKIEMAILERFSVLPDVRHSCADASGGGACPTKVAFLFEITSGLTQLEAWEAFFANAPPEKYSIYIEMKNQSATLPLQSYGAIMAEPVDTDYCVLFGGMAALMHAAYADASNAHFAFLSSDSLPLKSFNHVYQSLAEDAPATSKICMAMGFDKDSEYMCGMMDGMHKHIPLFRKAHQWSVLTREHAALILTHAPSIFPSYVEQHSQFPGGGGCSDEYMVLSSLRYALGAGAESWPEPEMEKKWNVAHQCTSIAVWPGVPQCMSPALPSGIGIPPLIRGWQPYLRTGPSCNLDESGNIESCFPFRADPFVWEKLDVEELKNMACSEYLFGRKMSQDIVFTDGSSSQTLDLTKELVSLWDLHADGSC